MPINVHKIPYMYPTSMGGLQNVPDHVFYEKTMHGLQNKFHQFDFVL